VSTSFLKMEGAGNDFIVLDDRQEAWGATPPERWVGLCARRLGVGADGVLLLQPDPGHDFGMRYYNADGHEAEMCGNGARCLAWAAAMEFGLGHDLDRAAPLPPGWEVPEGTGTAQIWRVTFSATDGSHSAVGWGSRVAVSLGDPEGLSACTLDPQGSQGEAADGIRVKLGVPHFVTRVPEPGAVDVARLGPELRHHPELAPEGANINWLASEPDGDGAFRLRTYERGVEAETLACGTGAASAAVAAAVEGSPSPIDLRTRGGHLLRVWFETGPKGPSNLWLEGPVSVVYRGILEEI
jgi:diaminopimelate epimerase